MLETYYVNRDNTANPNFDHEVHTESCPYCPGDDKRVYLGLYNNCADAIAKAKTHYSRVDGCVHCCNPCHHG